MKDKIIMSLGDFLTLTLAGIGISVAPNQFFGGLFLALAAAAYARRVSPEQDEREFWVVILGACLAAIIVAELHAAYWPAIPLQIAMATAGFLSRYVAQFVLRVAGLIEKKADRITDRVIDTVLPGRRDDDK